MSHFVAVDFGHYALQIWAEMELGPRLQKEKMVPMPLWSKRGRNVPQRTKFLVAAFGVPRQKELTLPRL